MASVETEKQMQIKHITMWYNGFAPFYQHVYPHLVPSYNEINYYISHIDASLGKKAKRILDLGCGPGMQSFRLCSHHREARVTLVDLSDVMISIAQNLGPLIEKIHISDFNDTGFIESLPEVFDIIIVSFALHHHSPCEIMSLYEKLYEKLNPTGVLFIVEEVFADAPGSLDIISLTRHNFMEYNCKNGLIPKEFIEFQNSYPAHFKPHFNFARIEDHVSWLARAGFAVSTPVISMGSALFACLKLNE
jgi:SAM-dependent methyltransferase